jgi:hypothetical protein
MDGADGRLAAVPGSFPVDPHYCRVTDSLNSQLDMALFGSVGEPYFRTWRARSGLRILEDTGLLNQIETGPHWYNTSDSALFWDSWGIRVNNTGVEVAELPGDVGIYALFAGMSPEAIRNEASFGLGWFDLFSAGTLAGSSNTLLEVYGHMAADETQGRLAQSYNLDYSNSTLSIQVIGRSDLNTIEDCVITDRYSPLIRLPDSNLDVRLYKTSASTAADNSWIVDAVAKPEANISDLLKHITEVNVDLRTALTEHMRTLGLLDVFEKHPLIWVRLGAALAAVCEVRANGSSV